MRSNRYLLRAGILAALQLPAVAMAQSQQPPNQLEEIVVTAQKRVQNFNDVGITVGVFTSKELTDLGLTQMKDLSALTPNVQIKDVVANSVPNITIRGVGLNDYAANNNPAAGIYVDDIYLVSPAMLTFGMFDLERVEVLKGPQGTLFGRNTTAGTVNFISRKPTDTLEGYMNLDYGNYERFVADGAISGPLSDTLSARFAFQTVQQGTGWQINRLTGRHVGKIDRTAARLQFDWKPTDSLDVLLNLHGGEDHSDVALIKIDNPFTTEDDNDPNPYRSGASNHPHMHLESKGVTLKADWTLSQTLTMTSVTGYEDFSRLHVEDRDGTSLRQLDGTFDNHIHQFSQELRLTSVRDDLVLIGGAFYGTDTVKDLDSYDSPDLLSLLGMDGFDTIGNGYTQDTRSAAVFLHSEWTFVPHWKLTTGARYTDESKHFRNAYTFLRPTSGTPFDVFPPVNNHYSVQDVSGKVGLDYSGVKDTLFYGSVSRGFKSGGFQGQLSFDPANLQPFRDETLIAYEVGAKTRLAGNTLELNSSLFFYDYSDMQFYGGLFDSPVGVLFGITNVGDARIKGAEADLWWRPMAGLDIRLGMGLLDTRITRSVVDGVATGSELPNSPKTTFDSMVRYQWPLGGNLRAEALVSAKYQGRVRFDVVRNPPEAIEPAYWLGDARVGIGSQDGRWMVSAWVRNLADKRYRTQVLYSSVGFGASYGAPRTYGLTLSVRM